jgi:ribonuclease HI
LFKKKSEGKIVNNNVNIKGISGADDLKDLIDPDLLSIQNGLSKNAESNDADPDIYIADRQSSFFIEDSIDTYARYNFALREKIERTFEASIWLSIGCWNLQTLNKVYSKRQNKLEFLRNILNDNKMDIFFLIDVSDVDNKLIINGYRKYSDGRSCLFVKHNIYNEFIVSRNCIFDTQSKLCFVYVTPLSDDVDLINNCIFFLAKGYALIGDINLKSNKSMQYFIPCFIGEDTLQTGFVTKRCVKRFGAIAAPSDHYFIYGSLKCDVKIDFPMRLAQISEQCTQSYVNEICTGIVPRYKPYIKPVQVYLNLNDRERVINTMLDDYLDNKLDKIYQRYRNVYFIGSKEPFLGTKVNSNIVVTFAKHLEASETKQYKDIPSVIKSDMYGKFLTIAKTKSVACTFDFMCLKDITEGLRTFLNANNAIRDREDPNDDIEDSVKFFDIDVVINNIIKVANKEKFSTIASTFFLVKNKKLQDFNDVRMIVIMPGFIKAFESIVYHLVSQYFLDFFTANKVRYQFGGIKGGSTYAAMLNLRMRYEEFGAKGVILIDLAKGYDTLDMAILVNYIKNYVNDETIRSVLLSWTNMVYNLDYSMNNKRIKRTRGVAMGLSLSPIVFEFYLDCALGKIDRRRLTCYVDDMGIVLEAKAAVIDNRAFVDDVLDALKEAKLVVNLLKSVLLSNDINIKQELGKLFKVVEEEKYLGRMVKVNGDGKLIGDDRYFNRYAFRATTCPYWANFFTKKLVFNSGVIAKFAYGLYMLSTSDKVVRNAAFRNAWFFLRANMPKFSYIQVVFSIINFFRFFIDSLDLQKWIARKRSGENANVIDKEVIDKISVDIPQLKLAIEQIKPRWDLSDNKDPFALTKHFNDFLFQEFKRNLLQLYLKEKKEKNIVVYSNLDQFLNSRLFAHFGFLQNVVFKHVDAKKRDKQVSIYLFLKSFFISLSGKLEQVNQGIIPDENFNIKDIYDNIDTEIDDSYKSWPNEDWDALMCERYAELWDLVDSLLFIEKSSKQKIPAKKSQPNIQPGYDTACLYVDGSYNIKNNKIGYGGVLIDSERRGSKAWKFSNWEYDEEGTNFLKNIYGELRATIMGLELVSSKGYEEVNLYYDYLGIEKYGNMEWSTDLEFISLYTNRMRQLKSKIRINFIKVTSHTGNKYNELADKIAKEACNIRVKAKPSFKSDFVVKQVEFFKKLYKKIFKILVIVDVVYMNNSLNDLQVDEFLYNLRIKFMNLEDLAQKLCRVAEMDEVTDEFDIRNDIFVDDLGV